MKKTMKNNNMQVHTSVSLCKHLSFICDCIVLKQSKEGEFHLTKITTSASKPELVKIDPRLFDMVDMFNLIHNQRKTEVESKVSKTWLRKHVQ